MKSILFLIHDLHYGGAEKVLVNLVNNLDKTKYSVTVQTLFDVGHNKNKLKNEVHYIGGFKRFFPGNATLMKAFTPNALCRMIIKGDYDIVVSFLEGSCCRIVSSYHGKKIAWIHIEHNSVNELASSFRSINEVQDCYNNFDKIICVAETVKKNFTSLLSVKVPCEVLYNVNETKQIIEESHEKQNVIDSNSFCFNIISVGKLSIKHKGFDRLIIIHKKLLDAGINNKLYIVGEGADRNQLEDLIQKLGVDDTCRLLGFHSNPYKYVAACDLFVCSSHHEGFSTAVTEALVLGVPVVSTDVSGAKELLGYNNEFGIVTDNDDTELYIGVKSILSDLQLLLNYKNKAIERGKQFSTVETTKAVENMLDCI